MEPIIGETHETQGLEDLSMSDGNEEVYTDNEVCNEDLGDRVEGDTRGETSAHDSELVEMNGKEDFFKINLKHLTAEDIMRVHFPSVEVAFMFYNMYASVQGFAARKSKTVWNIKGEMIQQTFVCNREGHRADKKDSGMNKRREPKPTTRCGCLARCQVHVGGMGGRWYFKYFSDVHNHEMVEEKYISMLPPHRQLDEYEKAQLNNMRKVGIRTPQIYGLFARYAGGYNNLRFSRRDLYNEQEKDRKPEFSDAKATLDFLVEMQTRDDMLFWRHTVDEEGRLEHLFWSDGASRRDFSVFGDVLAFDATYRKNRYLSPLVVFSGINHHNMSTVFASAIVSNETEATYVWLLEQFVEAMGGKSPVSVITDGDVAMRNAIRRVFPNAHHRLCAWHLIRNATSNVKNAIFISKFKHCMLGDFDVAEFNCKWDKLVTEFDLEENAWVLELYEKRRMWATSYIRGNFFAGFRTTSRCEGLHSEFGKYVTIKNNLHEFMQNFFRWLDYMRFREVEADFSTVYGDPVLKTKYEDLEKSAASVYTREIFLLFRPVLERACTCNVVGTSMTSNTFTYRVERYRWEGHEWRVTFCQDTLEFKCTCQRLESLGIPCEHLIRVMVHLNITQLPDCVVLKRWTKTAKESINGISVNSFPSRSSNLWLEYVGLVEYCKKLSERAYQCGRSDYMRKTIEIVKNQLEAIEAVIRGEIPTNTGIEQPAEGMVRDPVRVRSKGCGGASASSSQNKSKKMPKKGRTCSVCGRKGHNRASCPVQMENEFLGESQFGGSSNPDALEPIDEDVAYANVEMDVS